MTYYIRMCSMFVDRAELSVISIQCVCVLSLCRLRKNECQMAKIYESNDFISSKWLQELVLQNCIKQEVDCEIHLIFFHRFTH